MPPYRLARMSDEQMSAVESLENELGLTLVAYEPMSDALRESRDADEDEYGLEGIQERYQLY